MNDDTEKHGLIVNIGNRGNQFRTTVEPNLNIYFNELTNFSELFSTIIVKDKTKISLQDNEMNAYEIPLCYSK